MSTMAISVENIINRYSECGKEKCFKWLFANSPHAVNKVTLKKKFEKLINQYKNLLKSRNKHSFTDNLEKFKNERFLYPQSVPFKSRKSGAELEVNNVEDLNMAKNVIVGLADDLQKVSKNNLKLTEENENIAVKLSVRLATKSRLATKVEEKKVLKRKLKHLSQLVENKNRALKQLRAAKTYAHKQKQGYEKKYASQMQENKILKDNITSLGNQIEHLKKENRTLKAECEDLENKNEKDDIIELFDDDKMCFKPETQECVFDLLAHNVTSSHVSPVIKSVMELGNMKANRLPSTSTVNNMNVQRLIASQKQLAEVLKTENNMCFLSDETSKYGKKMEGFHVSTESHRYYVLGTRQIVTKSGQDTLSVLTDILEDINMTSKASENEISLPIIMNITSTMSDRAATQIKFNDLLESYRKDVLKEQMHENWTTLTQNEQLSLSSLNNFFCGLHALVHVAGAASDALPLLEQAYFDKEIPIYDSAFKTSEPGIVRLVRTASKAFSCGGDEKSGVYGHFKSFTKEFLHSSKLNSIPIKRYHGNRFNILFENASNVYFMHKHIQDYLKVDNSNRLLKAVKHDIEVPYFVAGLKALGLVHFLITAPLWTFIERKDIHILESCHYYGQLCAYIQESVANMELFIEGNLLMKEMNKDQLMTNVMFASLLEPSEYDESVQIILHTVLPAILETLKKLFCDFLDGGKWANPSTSLFEKTKSIPKHNKFSESVFGHIDRLLREKPNISFIAQEAYVMFCHNKTLQWMNEGSIEKKNEMLKECRREVKKIRCLFQKRRKEIEEKRKEMLNMKMKEMEEKEKRRVKKLEGHTCEIIEWGLWQTKKQVDNQLCSYSTIKQKMAALKAQLNFRKEILHQKIKHDDTIYKLSKSVNGKNKKLTVAELATNVKTLIAHSYTVQTNEEDGCIQLIGMDISMKFEIDNGSHWYDGHVISKVPGYPQWFNVKFDEDSAIYTYQLMDDYNSGEPEDTCVVIVNRACYCDCTS